MTQYGFVASGGGYRSFYTAGALVWLKKHDIPIVHVTSTSSGNNIVLDYLMWDWETEELPPTLTQTFRLSVKDIFDVFSNFAGLKPALIPTGTHLFTVDKDKCRKPLLLDRSDRQTLLKSHLQKLKWDILTTNITRRRSEAFRVNDILGDFGPKALDQFMDVFLAGITTIPYFKAIEMDGQYYLEGGYLDNTPMKALFEDPDVDEIIAVDFTDYDYHAEIAKLYRNHPFTLLFNSIEMNLLVNDIQLSLPNESIFAQALLINALLSRLGETSIQVGDRTYYHKPLRILRPSNLECMTVSLADARIQKEYFALGETEIAACLSGTVT